MPPKFISGISQSFLWVSQAERQVTYVLLTRSPLGIQEQAPFHPVRLACIRHAASVHPEPGSNSQLVCILIHYYYLVLLKKIDVVNLYICLVFKDQLRV